MLTGKEGVARNVEEDFGYGRHVCGGWCCLSPLEGGLYTPSSQCASVFCDARVGAEGEGALGEEEKTGNVTR